MIATFYSFKGGVGRSMALANVGRWFRLNGLRVIVVDWDLEAPGLESYFARGGIANDLRAAPGLIDLLTSYQTRWATLPWPSERAQDGIPAEAKPVSDVTIASRAPGTLNQEALAMLQEHLPPVSGLLQHIEGQESATPSESDAGLWLLSAGARDGNRFKQYADTVQSFDWTRFYDRYNGETFFEWLRLQFDAFADITLIDSRTGVTEMGGICTRQLADLVVALSATNEANLAGVERVMSTLRNPDLLKWRGGRPLQVVPIPARVDRQAENTRSIEWRDGFIKRMTEQLGTDATPFWDIHLPYAPYYAFEEKLVVGEPDRHEFLDKAYRGLGAAVAKHLVKQLDDTKKVQILRRNRDDDTLVQMLQSPDLVGEWAWSQVSEAQRPEAIRLLLRLVHVGEADEGIDAPAVMDISALSDEERQLAASLVAANLVKIHPAAEGKSLLRLALDDLMSWKRLAEAIEVDRPFLIWRQQLDAFAAAWQRSRSDEGTLMTGAILDEALRYARERALDLLPVDRQFIDASRQYVERHARQIRGLTEEKEQLERKLEETRSIQRPLGAPGQGASRGRVATLAGTAVVLLALVIGGYSFFARNAAVQAGDDAEAALRQADTAYGRGDFQTSMDAASRAIELRPEDPRGYLRRGQARVPLRNLDGALDDFQKAIQLGGSSSTFIGVASVYQKRGDFQSAHDVLSRGIEKDPKEGGLYRALGQLQEAEKNVEAAKIAYTSAINVNPKDAEAYFARGLLLLDDKRSDDARSDLENAARYGRDPALVTSATALLAKFPPRPGESGSGIVVQLRYPPDARGMAAKSVEMGLKEAGFAYETADIEPDRSAGTVRYFSSQDETIANAIKTIVESSLARGGQRARLLLTLSDRKSPDSQRVIEVFLPGKNVLDAVVPAS